MEERRTEERAAIGSTVEVEDEYFDEKLGTLVDISPRGLRLVGDEELELNVDYRLRLRLPEQILGKRTIRLVAMCVWSRLEPDTGKWQNGFRFTRVSDKDSSLIIGLILETKGTD